MIDTIFFERHDSCEYVPTISKFKCFIFKMKVWSMVTAELTCNKETTSPEKRDISSDDSGRRLLLDKWLPDHWLSSSTWTYNGDPLKLSKDSSRYLPLSLRVTPLTTDLSIEPYFSRHTSWPMPLSRNTIVAREAWSENTNSIGLFLAFR